MATPTSNWVALTGNPLIDGLIQGSAWIFSGPPILTYSFNINFALDPAGNVTGPGPGGNWTPQLSNAFTQALTTWSNVANISFQQNQSGTYPFQSSADMAATLTGNEFQELGAVSLGIFPDPFFANQLLAALGWTRQQYPQPEGDVFYDNYNMVFGYLNAGGVGFEFLVHEIGHALGLKHPSDDGGNNRPTFSALGIAQYDSERWTIMSAYEAGFTFNSGHAATPMPLDILAIQRIYGANMSFHAGNDTYQISPDLNNPYTTVWDAGGIDTISVSAFNNGLTMDLRPGVGYITGGNTGFTAIAYNVTIENAYGSAYNDVMIGNDAANIIDGLGGVDQMEGGAGNDTYYVDTFGDLVIENLNEGTDKVFASLSYTLTHNAEDLELIGNANLAGTGNALNNVLTGNLGIDTLTGGQGDDTYVLNNVSDVVIENPSEGTDTVVTPFSYSLVGTSVENITLIGSGNLTATGNEFDNVLRSNAGINTLVGGLGNDTYVLTNASHVITENPGEGMDWVESLVDITLPANFENLRLIGSAGIDGTGNALDNVLVGNIGSNVLIGAGGNDTFNGAAGRDWLAGGLDNDVFNGGSSNDVISGGGGLDVIDGGWGFDVASFDGLLASYTISRTGADISVTGLEGAVTLSSIEKLHFADSDILLKSPVQASPVDFDANGTGDLLWRHNDGAVAIWTMSGSSPSSTVMLPWSATPDWMIADAADFTADGRADILWHRNDGHVAVWTMNGTTITGGAELAWASTPGWMIMGTADFNGDNREDILWHRDDGHVAVWTLNGTIVTGGAELPVVSQDWTIAGSADFNADNKDDIIWRNDDGQVAVWTMDGFTLAGATVLPWTPTQDWTLVDTADFNRDGSVDLLWHNDNGSVAIWTMNGLSPSGGTVLPWTSTSEWTLEGVGDLNADQNQDLVWRNDDGQLAVWMMNGLNITSAALLPQLPSTDWAIS